MSASLYPKHLEYAYVDDSGDPGMKPGSTSTMALGCVLVSAYDWTSRLDKLQDLRRGIHADYGIRIRDEVKGEWLVGVKKHFREAGLGDGQLRDIFQRHMDILSDVANGIFAVVVEKDRILKRETDVEDMAWTMLFQRLRFRTLETGHPIMLIHDQTSDYKALRSRWRKFRRYNYTPAGQRSDARLLIEDPISRDSQQSYFIQLADLVAYSASRRIVPAQGKRIARCSPEMWMRAEEAHLAQVSTSRWDGIVVWPGKKGSAP